MTDSLQTPYHDGFPSECLCWYGVFALFSKPRLGCLSTLVCQNVVIRLQQFSFYRECLAGFEHNQEMQVSTSFSETCLMSRLLDPLGNIQSCRFMASIVLENDPFWFCPSCHCLLCDTLIMTKISLGLSIQFFSLNCRLVFEVLMDLN